MDVQDPHILASNALTAVTSLAVQFDKRQEAIASWNAPLAPLAHKHLMSDLSVIPASALRRAA